MKSLTVNYILSLLLLFHSGSAISQGNLVTAGAERRLAMVVGNSSYQFAGELPNPVNDARAIRDALLSVGFEVYEYENLNQSQMKRAIDDFGAKLKSYTVGLFFYAGHGIQSRGANYLIPVDANLKTEQQIEYDCVQADRVLGFMEAAGSKINIVILDACRNNPFERSWSRAVDGSGLAFMNAPTGSLIAYSTSPGRTASDGSGSNGLYTSALLQNIKSPNITILQMFQNVRRSVSERSSKQQIPWESTSLTDDFYFVSSYSQSDQSTVNANYRKESGSYYFYLNDEPVALRTFNTSSDNDLIVYDPVSNYTFLLENYYNQPDNKTFKANVLGNTSSAFWKESDGRFSLYLKGDYISGRTHSVFVGEDVIVYDTITNTSFLLKNYKRSDDNKMRPAIILDNSGYAFWVNQDNMYRLYVKGDEIQDRTRGCIVDKDLLAYDTTTNVTYLFRDFIHEKDPSKLHPAEVLSYQDYAFWMKKEGKYWLIVKGVMIQDHTSNEWKSDDLYVTDKITNITYILLNYDSAPENKVHVALIQ